MLSMWNQAKHSEMTSTVVDTQNFIPFSNSILTPRLGFSAFLRSRFSLSLNCPYDPYCHF